MGSAQSDASHLQGVFTAFFVSPAFLTFELQIGSSAKPTTPNDISPEADDFLQLTFELDHEARPDACDLVKHAWIIGTKLADAS